MNYSMIRWIIIMNSVPAPARIYTLSNVGRRRSAGGRAPPVAAHGGHTNVLLYSHCRFIYSYFNLSILFSLLYFKLSIVTVHLWHGHICVCVCYLVCICVYMCVYVYMCMYVYIYIIICMYVCVCMYIYIYIYRERER